MSDIITRLLLKTNDFDANLNKSKQSVNSFQGDISGMASRAGAGVMKFAGAIGLAVGAGEGFMKVIRSSQTTSDEFDNVLNSCTSTVNSFFSSLSTGDFSTFNQGLNGIIAKAYAASAALDQLGNTRMAYNYFGTKTQAEIAENSLTALDKGLAKPEREQGFIGWKGALNEKKEYSGAMKADALGALIKTVVEGTVLDSDSISLKDFESITKLDLNNPTVRDKEKEKLTNSFAQYQAKIKDLEKQRKSGGVADWAFPDSEGAKDRKTKNSGIDKAQRELNDQYKQSILYKKILDKWSDEELQGAFNLAAEYNKVNEELASQERTYNKAYNKFKGEKDKVNGGDKKDIAPSGSIAYFDAELSKKNKELINATTSQARAAVQIVISELEAKKLNLKIRVEKDVFETIHGKAKGGELKFPDARGVEALNEMAVNRAVIGWYEQVIAQKKVELSKATDTETSSFIQSEINKLKDILSEFNKLKEGGGSKIGSVYSAFRNNSSTKKDKDGNIVETDLRKQAKGMKLPKVKSPISKKDIKLNDEFNSSLTAMGDIMGSLSGSFDTNTQSVLQWGATLLSTIAQAIPAILGMIPAKKAEALASKESAGSAMLDAGAKVVEAHAGIPFAGIAIGLAGVASIIAVLSNMPKFATGGIVPGASFTGDKVPALLNSGEMILNGGQQSNLFRMLNSNISSGITAEHVSPVLGNVSRYIIPDESEREIKISGTLRANGSVLETVLNNYTHKKSKVR